MAVIGSPENKNNKKNNSIQNKLNSNRNFNLVNKIKTGQHDLSVASGLHKNNDVAKPKNAINSINPLKKARQNRKTNNNAKKSFFNKESNVSEENNELEDNKTESQEAMRKVGGIIKRFIMRHPFVLVYIALPFFVIIFIFMIILAVGGDFTAENIFDTDDKYGDFFAFDNTEIYILNENGTAPIGSHTVYLSDFVKGVVYMDTRSMDLSSLTDEQLKNFYTSLILVRKAQILKKGEYNYTTRTISLKVTDFKYCDANGGCKVVSKNGKQFYLDNSIEYNVDNVIRNVDGLDNDKLKILNYAYAESVPKIVVPTSVNEPLTEYKWQPPTLSQSTYSTLLSKAKSNIKYEKLITDTFPGYKVYNLDDYVNQFASVYLSQYMYWWPIGSDEKDSNGLYSGDPTETFIEIEYGPSFANNKINKGMLISGSCGSTKVISIGEGKVRNVGSNNTVGKYVIINHDDGLQSLYGALSSVKVTVGQEVKAGTLIGIVGKYKDSCGLYLEMHKNGVDVNPLDYISPDNPRISKANYITFVQGENNQQTVCKTFLASGFSKNAVAGLMANIENESGFMLNNLSDGGTSNGLFQWHNQRLVNLQHYCGREYLTSIKCQLDYFLYEITITPTAQNETYNYLIGNHSAYEMGYEFCMRFERPAGKERSANERGLLAANKYIHYVNNGCR